MVPPVLWICLNCKASGFDIAWPCFVYRLSVSFQKTKGRFKSFPGAHFSLNYSTYHHKDKITGKMFTYGCLRGLKSGFNSIGILTCTDWPIMWTTVLGPAYERRRGDRFIEPSVSLCYKEVDRGVDAQICWYAGTGPFSKWPITSQNKQSNELVRDKLGECRASASPRSNIRLVLSPAFASVISCVFLLAGPEGLYTPDA